MILETHGIEMDRTRMLEAIFFLHPLCSLPPSACRFGVGFGYLNTFSQGIWSTRDTDFISPKVGIDLVVQTTEASSKVENPTLTTKGIGEL